MVFATSIERVLQKYRFLSFTLLAISLLSLNGCATFHPFQQDEITYTLGNQEVIIKRISTGQDGFCFFNMHENEDTSVKSARRFLRRNHEGRIYSLRHGGQRNIRFNLADKSYAFDPNRIFTDEGIRLTMQRFGAYDETGHKLVAQFARTLIRLIRVDDQTLMVALHNNGENEYSLSSYQSGGRYEGDARLIYLNPAKDHDDFFFVTDQRFYDVIKSAGYNVALQNNEEATDDGSLSVYCGRAGVPYVNIEAQHGHKRAQTEMLSILDKLSAELK